MLQQLRYRLASLVGCFRYQKQCSSRSAGNLDSLGGIGFQNLQPLINCFGSCFEASSNIGSAIAIVEEAVAVAFDCIDLHQLVSLLFGRFLRRRLLCWALHVEQPLHFHLASWV